MSKINVLVIPSDRFGVGKFRSISPHVKLQELYPEEFDVTIEYSMDLNNLSQYDKYQIMHIHKGLMSNMDEFRNAIKTFKNKGIITVLDLDDFWEVGQYHPSYVTSKKENIAKLIIENVKLFDYVTTTTPIFAKEIRKYNKNVFVLPNAIDPDEKQFIPQNIESEKLRFGFVMGSTHEHDLKIMEGAINKISQDMLKQIQLVLCGFDLRGNATYYMPDGTIKQRPLQPQETVWYRYEKIVTDNYKICSPQYQIWLHQFLPHIEYPNVDKETYRRIFTKNINEYATHYNNIDVLMAPLKDTEFNLMKSQLKVIEAGMFKKGLICSNYGPYTLDLVSAIDKGGKINPKGNALLVDMNKNHKDWTKYIVKLTKEPELLEQIRFNLYETVKDKYNLNNVTKERAEFYKKIVG